MHNPSSLATERLGPFAVCPNPPIIATPGATVAQ